MKRRVKFKWRRPEPAIPSRTMFKSMWLYNTTDKPAKKIQSAIESNKKRH